MRSFLYIPLFLNMAQLLTDNGHGSLAKPLHLDKFHYVVDHMYLQTRIFKRDSDGYVPLNIEVLRNIIGQKFTSQVIDVLQDLGVICEKRRKPGKAGYVPGKSSRNYRLIPPYAEATYRRIPIEDRKLIERMEKSRCELNLRAVIGSTGRALVRQSVEALTLDFGAAREYVVTADYDTEGARVQRLCMIDCFEKNYHYFSSDHAGRFYHLFVSLSRDLRPFTTWRGKALYSIDVTSCQPALHAGLYPTKCREKARFAPVLSEGRFYAFLNDKLQEPFDLKNSDMKSKFKAEVFHHIFYGSPYVKETHELWKIFHREFPILASIMTKEKKYNRRDLPVHMQSVEASTIFRIADELAERYKDKEICLISIHDCLVTTQEMIEEVKDLMELRFREKLGFRLPVNVKQITRSADVEDSLQLAA